MAENQQPVIIKKVKKGGHGHHGGAWKLAYADFVTAMMAFFLLMWLLGTTDPSYRQGVAEYFKDPWKPSLNGGANTGDAVSVIKGGGDDITLSEGQVKMTNQGKEEDVGKASEKESEDLAPQAQAQAQELLQLEALKEKIEEMIDSDALLHEFQDQLKLDITEDGLRIQIIDEEGRPMFDSASAKLQDYAAKILREIAPIIGELPNKISIAGHTDAKPFPGGGQGYTNWELSADRANAARKELIKGGLKEDKVMRVVGLASSAPMVPKVPLDPSNRRISITVMNRQTADDIALGEGSVDVSATKPLNKEHLIGTPPAAPTPEAKPLSGPKRVPGTLTGGKLDIDTPPEKGKIIPGTLTGKARASDYFLKKPAAPTTEPAKPIELPAPFKVPEIPIPPKPPAAKPAEPH